MDDWVLRDANIVYAGMLCWARLVWTGSGMLFNGRWGCLEPFSFDDGEAAAEGEEEREND